MKVNLQTSNINKSRNSASFKSLNPYAFEVGRRLQKFGTVKVQPFEMVADAASFVLQQGNEKPKLLVEKMVRFIEHVEAEIKEGVKPAVACLDNAALLINSAICNKRAIDNLTQGGTKKINVFDNRWDYLAVNSARHGYEDAAKGVVPQTNMEKTDSPIAFTHTDDRDMLEFLRRNWTRGNIAYRNLEKGKGLKGWIGYLREELLPQYWPWDENLGRKH